MAGTGDAEDGGVNRHNHLENNLSLRIRQPGPAGACCRGNSRRSQWTLTKLRLFLTPRVRSSSAVLLGRRGVSASLRSSPQDPSRRSGRQPEGCRLQRRRKKKRTKRELALSRLPAPADAAPAGVTPATASERLDP